MKLIGYVWNYLRCVWYNRFTLAGVVCFSLGLTLHFVSIKHFIEAYPQEIIYILCMTGWGLVCVTGWGINSYVSYIRTTKRINKTNGKAHMFYIEKNDMYCYKAGQRLAVKDAAKRFPNLITSQ